MGGLQSLWQWYDTFYYVVIRVTMLIRSHAVEQKAEGDSFDLESWRCQSDKMSLEQ
jgi:hypothetical protein